MYSLDINFLKDYQVEGRVPKSNNNEILSFERLEKDLDQVFKRETCEVDHNSKTISSPVIPRSLRDFLSTNFDKAGRYKLVCPIKAVYFDPNKESPDVEYAALSSYKKSIEHNHTIFVDVEEPGNKYKIKFIDYDHIIFSAYDEPKPNLKDNSFELEVNLKDNKMKVQFRDKEINLNDKNSMGAKFANFFLSFRDSSKLKTNNYSFYEKGKLVNNEEIISSINKLKKDLHKIPTFNNLVT
ncbi:MAG: hypothetical protein MK033_11775 [Candidatus Caenarcaniphilales bacterium]|nr:hypothetical protein [Candidatus Caenarcaniphilales bacterium]